MSDAWSPQLKKVWAVLNRETPIGALEELRASLSPTPNQFENSRIAFGFDTNAIFRLGAGQAGPDVVDYLRLQHAGPLIVPGQTLQEIWNNQITGIAPIAKSLRSALHALEAEVQRVDQRFGITGDHAKQAIHALVEEYGDTFDEEAEEAFKSTLELLVNIAKVAYVPRAEFAPLAQVRHDTRTPPGFKDTGHGDFFVWADFLYALSSFSDDEVDGVVLVTNDTKKDWSRDGVAHPVLTAEALAVMDRPFSLWTLSQFTTYVRREIEPGT